MMKIFIILIILLTGCTANKTNYSFIVPLPHSSDLTDETISAEFSSNDFNWVEKILSCTLFSEDLYDAVEVNMMKVGDSLLYNGDTIIVSTIENKDGYIIVNNGIDEGGADLKAYEGGTYRANQFDDHFTYTQIGQMQIPLSDSCTIINCGQQYTDPYDTIYSNQKQYIENLDNREFSKLNTKIVIEKGIITEIKRRWIP